MQAVLTENKQKYHVILTFCILMGSSFWFDTINLE